MARTGTHARTIADELRAAVETTGLNCRELGEATGVDPSTIWRFRQGRGITFEAASAIALALGARLVVAPWQLRRFGQLAQRSREEVITHRDYSARVYRQLRERDRERRALAD